MKRGRPTKSQVRQNVVEILYHLGKGYGYEISKIYNTIFPKVTQRCIYYHLRKGIQTNEIALHKIEQEQGTFSWGNIAEKIYYTVGEKGKPRSEPRVRDFIAQWKK